MMLSHLRSNAAVLSLLVPGWGQFEQRRAVAGRLFLGWALLSLLVAAYSPLIGLSSLWGWVDLVTATLWSATDALFHPPEQSLPNKRLELAGARK